VIIRQDVWFPLSLYIGGQWPPAPATVFSAMVNHNGSRLGEPDVQAALEAVERGRCVRIVEHGNPPARILVQVAVPRLPKPGVRLERFEDPKWKLLEEQPTYPLEDLPRHLAYYWRLDDLTERQLYGLRFHALGRGESVCLTDVNAVREETILEGKHWVPANGDAGDCAECRTFNVPYPGFLHDLRALYDSKKSSRYARPEPVVFVSKESLVPYDIMCFKLMDEDGKLFSYPSYRRHEVSAMLRHSVGAALAGKIDPAYLLGHCDLHPFYIPLPTISPYGDEEIRRAVIAEPRDGLGMIRRFKNRAALASLNLVSTDSKLVCRAVHQTDEGGSVFRDYLQPARQWRTVTPMVVDRNNGSEERIRRRIVAMLRFQGYPEPARVSFRRVFWDVKHLPIKVREGARLFAQVEVEFPVRVAGPVFAGRGAGYGIGLFARK
jgi:CRISPR-associated protein Csb2